MRIHIPESKFAPYFLEYEEVESTQDIAFSLLEEENIDSCIILAYSQKKARGRKGAQWFSPYGGLWMSFGFKDVLARNLYLVSTISMSNFLEKEFDIKNKIKIPNDIVFENRKICGIIVESKKNLSVAGIGLNLNIKEFPEEIKNRAISVYLIKNVEYDLKKIFLSYTEEFLRTISDLSLKDLINYYIIKTCVKGKNVRFEYTEKLVKGRAIGITPDFEILIENKGKFEIGLIKNFDEI